MPPSQAILDLAAESSASLQPLTEMDQEYLREQVTELAHLAIDLHDREHDKPALYCHPACQRADAIVFGRA